MNGGHVKQKMEYVTIGLSCHRSDETLFGRKRPRISLCSRCDTRPKNDSMFLNRKKKRVIVIRIGIKINSITTKTVKNMLFIE